VRIVRTGLLVLVYAGILAGCAVPRWVPWLGSNDGDTPTPAVRASRPARSDAVSAQKPAPPDPDSIADRVVAVVNNDAITLGELTEMIVAYRQENRQRATASEEELASQFLNRLIENRLQLQEAEREKIVVDEAEITEELNERVKKLGAPTFEAFEQSLKAQGITMESVRKRIRDSIRMSRVVRRKVALRVSVTEAEIDRYLAENREKLETGLSYHARHILIVPEGTSESAWAAARAKADAVYAELKGGADFAETARSYSADTSAKDGGDLGTLKRGELAQDVESEIIRLSEGEVSSPYRSSLGWHLFKLESKEALEGEGLGRVRQQVREILFREKYEARLDTWLKEIRQRAVIEVRL
jgi:peptidyl-prolyl cis-trans isomerase SurA